MNPEFHEETIQYKIYLEAVQAISSMESLKESAENLDSVIAGAGEAMQAFSEKTGLSLKTTESIFQKVLAKAAELRSAMSDPKNGGDITNLVNSSPLMSSVSSLEGPFGLLGNNVGFKMVSEGLKAASTEQAKLQKLTEAQAQSEEKAAQAAQKVTAELEKSATIMGKTVSIDSAQAVVSEFSKLSKMNFLDPKMWKPNVQSLTESIRSIAMQTGASFDEVGKYIKSTFSNIHPEAVTQSVEKLNQEVRGTAPAMEKASGASKDFMSNLLSLQNLIRTAFGTLLAMAIFQLVQFAQESVQTAIKAVRDLEVSLYNLSNAEKALSEAGVDVTFKDLEAVADRLREKFKGMFSKVDIQDAIADIAIGVKELGMGADQIEKLAQAAAVVQLRQPDKSLKEIVSGEVTAVLSGRTQALQQMGLSINEATVKEKALQMGLVETGKALSEEARAAAIVQLIYEATSEEADNFATKQKGLREASQQAQVAWQDFLTELGKLSAPALIEFLEGGVKQLQRWSEWLEKNEQDIQRVVAAVAGLIRGISYLNENGASFSNPIAMAMFTMQGGWEGFIQSVYDGMQEAKKSAEDFGKAMEHATNPEGQAGKIEIDTESAQKEIDDLIKDLDRLDQRAAEITINFNIKMKRMEEDHFIDMERMRQDYENQVADTIASYAAKRHAAETKYRNAEIAAEERFQEQMRQLRERFLFSLEDALRERDARQVLRLVRQYQMDKEAAINEYNIAKRERARQHAEEMQQLKQEEAERLRQLQEEYELRRQREEEDYQLKKQREEEEYNKEMEDLKTQAQQRMEQFAQSLADELGLKSDAAQTLYDKLNEYYGQGGFLDGMYDYSAQSMVANAQFVLSTLQSLVAQYNATMASMSAASPGVYNPYANAGSIGGQADGGMYFANRPTNATFGERGPELATFIPLRGLAKTTFSPGTSKGGMDGGAGKMEILLTLSPDLEARIMSKTMDATARVITRVNNSKG